MRTMFSTKTKKYLLVQFLLIGMVLASLFLIATKCYIWFDESFTINLVRKKVPDLIRLTAMDVHPPLYYLAVRLCVVLFGENIFSFYLTSILCYGALLVATSLFFCRYFSPEASFLVTAAFCAIPSMLMMGPLQLRMYSMAMLFVTVSFYLAYIVVYHLSSMNYGRSRRYLFLLALSNVLAAYTHYFAGVAAAAISFFLLIVFLWKKGRRKKMFLTWCLYCGGMIVLYLPWLPVLFRQMSAINGDYWIAPFTLDSLSSYWNLLFNMQPKALRLLLIAFYLIGLFLFFLRFKRDGKNIWMLGCYVVILLWFAFGIGYSCIRTPILIDRYLLTLLPLAWLPVLFGYTRLSSKPVLGAALLLLTVCFVYNYKASYQERATYSQKGLRDYIAANASEKDIFLHFYIQDLSICEAYFPEMEHYVMDYADDGQAFRYWPLLVDCHELSSADELPDTDANIWCLNDSCIPIFEEMGYQVDYVKAGAQTFFQIHK